MVDLSVCIPYYGEFEYLRQCLASIDHRQPGSSIEIVVVDDAAPEPCAGLVAREFPHVRVIRNARNLGFAGAVNVGWRATSGRHVLVVNSDTEMLEGLEEMIRYLDEHPDAGAVGPRIVNPDGTFQGQCRRGRLTVLSALGYGTGLDRLRPEGALGAYLERWRDDSETQVVGALSGACMMVRRKALERAGGFDESYVLYGEDLDLCYRLSADGWRIVYLPAAEAEHAGGRGGSRRRIYRSKFLYWRALWLILSRHARTRWFPLYSGPLAAGLSLGLLVSCIPLGGRARRMVGTRKGRRRSRRDERSGTPRPRAMTPSKGES